MEINKLIIILIIVLIFFACVLFIIKRNSKKINFNISGGSCKSDFFIDNDIEMPGLKTYLLKY